VTAPVYPTDPGSRGELTVLEDGSWWQWVKFSWEREGRWVKLPSPVRDAEGRR